MQFVVVVCQKAVRVLNSAIESVALYQTLHFFLFLHLFIFLLICIFKHFEFNQCKVVILCHPLYTVIKPGFDRMTSYILLPDVLAPIEKNRSQLNKNTTHLFCIRLSSTLPYCTFIAGAFVVTCSDSLIFSFACLLASLHLY